MAIDRVAVLGAGTMGRGIAQVAALAGYVTVLRDVDATIIGAASANIRASLAKGVDKGEVDPGLRDEAIGRLTTTTNLGDAVAAADLVIEAVPEDMELKRRVFADIDAHAPKDAVLASNTSSLSIARIAEATSRPARVVGMHFFNPVPAMPLVEVVRHDDNDEDVVRAVVEAARRMGKEPIVVKDVPGFATSRLGIALGLEAIRMLEDDVASAEDIDRAMELGYRHPMGPLRLTDLVGLDVRLAISEHLAKELGRRFDPPELLRTMVAQGRIGKKAGRGFYEYDS